MTMTIVVGFDFLVALLLLLLGEVAAHLPLWFVDAATHDDDVAFVVDLMMKRFCHKKLICINLNLNVDLYQLEC